MAANTTPPARGTVRRTWTLVTCGWRRSRSDTTACLNGGVGSAVGFMMSWWGKIPTSCSTCSTVSRSDSWRPVNTTVCVPGVFSCARYVGKANAGAHCEGRWQGNGVGHDTHPWWLIATKHTHHQRWQQRLWEAQPALMRPLGVRQSLVVTDNSSTRQREVGWESTTPSDSRTGAPARSLVCPTTSHRSQRCPAL